MSKRGNNEGSIYPIRKRGKDGVLRIVSYRASISLGFDEKGKRQRVHFNGKTRKEVADKLAVGLKKVQDGVTFDKKTVTMQQVFDAYLKEVEPTLRKTTMRSYRQMLVNHAYAPLGKLKLAELTTKQVQELLRQRLENGLSPRSVAYLRMILRSAVQTAVNWEWVSRNVVNATKPPRVEAPVRRVVDLDTLKQVRAAVAGHRLECLFLLIMALGLRISEALGLRWTDLILQMSVVQENGVERKKLVVKGVRVERQLQWPTGSMPMFTPPKSNAGKRPLPAPAFLTELLEKQRRLQTLESRDWNPQGPYFLMGEGLIFRSDEGSPLSARNVNRALTALMKSAKQEHLNPRDMRRLCATMLANERVPIRIAMHIMGHSQLKMLLEVYAQVLPEGLENAMEAIDEIWSSSKK